MLIKIHFENGCLDAPESYKGILDKELNKKDEESLRYYKSVVPALQGEIERLCSNGSLNYTKLAHAMNHKGIKSRFYKDFTYASVRSMVLKLKKEGNLTWSEK